MEGSGNFSPSCASYYRNSRTLMGPVNSLSISDEELVIRLKNGEIGAGAVLYSRHKNGIYSFCLRMLTDEDAAKDASQETFLKMITKIHSIEKGIACKSWLFSVARNEVLMVIRRKNTILMEQFDDETIVFDHSTPLSISIQMETKEKLEKAIQQLKPAYREAYLLREIEGMTYNEIAQLTSTTVSAVKTKLYKSRVALNEMLKPFF